MNLVLIGFMGTGKSTLGKLLAADLGYQFVDTDLLIEERHGKKITEIFKDKGEAYFRKIESELARELSQSDRRVIATGGGFPLNPRNLELLRPNSIIITLTAAPSIIRQRAGNDQTRPLLNVPDPLTVIGNLLKERAPFYQNTDLTVDTSDNDPAGALEKIHSFLKRRGGLDGKN